MNKLKLIAISLLFSNISSFAADDGYYAELGYTSINYSYTYSSDYSFKWNQGHLSSLFKGDLKELIKQEELITGRKYNTISKASIFYTYYTI